MREMLDKKAEMTKQEAQDLVERCLKVLYYRDARSYNRVSSFMNPLMGGKISLIPVTHI